MDWVLYLEVAGTGQDHEGVWVDVALFCDLGDESVGLCVDEPVELADPVGGRAELLDAGRVVALDQTLVVRFDRYPLSCHATVGPHLNFSIIPE